MAFESESILPCCCCRDEDSQDLNDCLGSLNCLCYLDDMLYALTFSQDERLFKRTRVRATPAVRVFLLEYRRLSDAEKTRAPAVAFRKRRDHRTQRSLPEKAMAESRESARQRN